MADGHVTSCLKKFSLAVSPQAQMRKATTTITTTITTTTETHPRGVKRASQGINEENVPGLVDRFLQLVHSKNPVLNTRQIREAARHVAEDGVGWDASSCIVVRSSTLIVNTLAIHSIQDLTLSVCGLRRQLAIHSTAHSCIAYDYSIDAHRYSCSPAPWAPLHVHSIHHPRWACSAGALL